MEGSFMKPHRRFQKLIHLVLLLWPVVALVNCAYQYRETDSGLSPAQVQARLLEVLTAAQSSSGESAARIQTAQTLLNQGNTSIYYSVASNSGGMQGRVIDLFPSAFELVSDGMNINQVKTLEIFLVYRNDGVNIDTTLILAARNLQDQITVSSFAGGVNANGMNGMIQGQEFQAIVSGPNGNTFTLASFDVDPETNDLNDVIQLEVFQGTTVDDGALVGKITTLDGRD
jgi:hypothetical protein